MVSEGSLLRASFDGGLRTGEAGVTLVSDTDGMLYQPLLPEVAVGAIDPRIASLSCLWNHCPGSR